MKRTGTVANTIKQVFAENPNQKLNRKYIVTECLKRQPKYDKKSFDRMLSSMTEVPYDDIYRIRRVSMASFVYQPTADLSEFFK